MFALVAVHNFATRKGVKVATMVVAASRRHLVSPWPTVLGLLIGRKSEEP